MQMEIYFAPLEGLTDSVYRRLHHDFFGGVDCYYMPFFSPTIHRTLTNREDRELPKADSVPFRGVPQLLTKNPEDFLWAARVCGERGYNQVNLNVGCPSGTVVAKGKGAGMLANPDELDCFFERIFRDSPVPISVKTRLGLSVPEEFETLMQVFNRYPIRELTVHPRVRKDFYAAPVREEWFRYALENSKNPLCYNGNLCTAGQIRTFCKKYPQVKAVMIGRGLVGDPGMLLPAGTDRETLREFMDALLEAYMVVFGGSRNAMFRMKENWRYLLSLFEGSEKLGKRLRKATDIGEYRAIVSEIFQTLPLRKNLEPDW